MDSDWFISVKFWFIQRLISFALVIVKYLDVRIGILPRSVSIKYTQRIFIPSSKDKKRLIEVHVYEPPVRKGREGPLPVHISFHGGGYVLPVHGADAELCAYWAMTLNCIVLDVNYAKAPRHPHPAAIWDGIDVVKYVAAHPETYDASKITLGGYSSGANLAILAALGTPEDVADIEHVVAWYPPTDYTKGHTGPRRLYLPMGIDRSDPTVSPLFADSSLFPPITLIAGDKDPLFSDSEELAKKLKADGLDCDLHIVPDAGHAWERFVKKDTPLWAERDKALAHVKQRLRDVYGAET